MVSIKVINLPSWYMLYSQGLSSYPELRQLFVRNMSFEEMLAFFRQLARKKGAPYALEALKVAPISPTVNIHLLAHTIGDILQGQYGAKGIIYCTPHFRNACSHSIVGTLLINEGEAVLVQVARTCQQSKGTGKEYEQCMHGIGHGLLSGVDYNAPRAFELCQKIGTPSSHGRDSAECIGGAAMELVVGGGHDKDIYERESKKYLKADDPFYPCDSSMVPPRMRPTCYEYFMFRLFAQAGADPHAPDVRFFKDAIRLCDRLADTEERKGCYRGFGREFIGMQTPDLRRNETQIAAQLKQVYAWCLLAGNKEGAQSCLTNAVQTLYWNGIQAQKDAVSFCAYITDTVDKSTCMLSLIDTASYNWHRRQDQRSFCRLFPKDYQDVCTRTTPTAATN